MNIDLNSNNGFDAVFHTLRDLMFNVLSWLHSISIGGVSLLYINLGFVLLITLFAILLPVLRNSGANELNDIGQSRAREISNRQRNRNIRAGDSYSLDSNGRVHRK